MVYSPYGPTIDPKLLRRLAKLSQPKPRGAEKPIGER